MTAGEKSEGEEGGVPVGSGMLGAAVSNRVMGKASLRRFFPNILREKRVLEPLMLPSDTWRIPGKFWLRKFKKGWRQTITDVKDVEKLKLPLTPGR